MKRIRKNDTVKIIAGTHKGKIVTVKDIKGNQVYLDGIRVVERHYKATSFNQGGKRDIHLPIHISNVALVTEGEKGKEKTSKVSYQIKDGKKVRTAKTSGKEVK